MKDKNYKPRIIDNKVAEYLSVFGAVCIEGPKWCGKTWTSRHHSESEYLVGDPQNNFQNRQLAQLSPDLVLAGETPRLIDEWQEVTSIWDAVRYEVDSRGEKGQFILTGSSTPKRKGVLHSGVGRIGKLRMRPMSLFEAGRSSGEVSLAELCEGKLTPKLTGDVDIHNLIDCIIRGGWPGNQDVPIESAGILPKEYITGVVDDEVHRIDDVQRDKRKIELLLRSLARNESTTVTNNTIINDIKDIDDEAIDKNTVSVYMDIFNRLFLTDNQLPFSTNIRSSIRVKQAEKRHFADPSIACALLGATPEKLLGDLNTLGFLFEALCERDLRIYAEVFDAKLYHYQDYNNNEIDAVVELKNGNWCAFEIKLGANQIDNAAAQLISIRDSIAAQKDGIPPSVLCVICGMANAVYQRKDGVYVIPITALKD